MAGGHRKIGLERVGADWPRPCLGIDQSDEAPDTDPRRHASRLQTASSLTHFRWTLAPHSINPAKGVLSTTAPIRIENF